ncbi:MAG: alpha-L-fucosidase [Clostridiales bacterium]|jgi:alpha-L-fucosidase|nr:alpha-L-fucosidase [Clostridiales bacterium]
MINRFRFHDARDWFNEKRLGLFIHWGIYSIPAWHEQMEWRGRMPRKEYEPLMREFNPVKYDPDAWLALAKSVGMEFVTITTKHHDGFCMFDSKYTDFKITNTPYRKDIVKMLADAAARQGLVMGLYYSIPDWNHKNYPNQGRHHEMWGPRAGDEPDYDKYFAYMENQVTELCTGYGPIGQLFWDINVAGYNRTAFNDQIRKLQPSIVINNRGPENWDYSTPERHVPDGMEFTQRTEAVQSLGRESWGHKLDEDYYNPKYIMQSIDKILAMGGNYMLNVGPKADGTLDERDTASLQRIGRWYTKVREAFTPDTYPATSMITQATHGEMKDRILLTRRVNTNTIYVHAYEDLATNAISMRPFTANPVKATLLNDGSPVETVVSKTPGYHHEDRAFLRLRGLPTTKITDEPLVVKLEFDGALCE